MLFRLLVPALMWAGSASAALQVPFADPLPTAERSQGIAAQLNASAFAFDEYAHLTHAGFPNYRVRAKKTHVCDGTAECAAHSAYTGYIDVGARHLFFYFFKSRRDWTKDDLVFWSTGGPGCSSALSLFMENGPLRITDGIGPRVFENGWDQLANVVFVDQPVGTGFSYADHGETVSTTEEAAEDVVAFLSIFTEHFSLRGRAIHLASSSYGGRYIPLFASAVLDSNPRLVQAGYAPLNLSSSIIGNDWTDFTTMIPSYYDMACAPPGFPPVLPISTCTRMKQAAPRCEQRLLECKNEFDPLNCAAARSFCEAELSVPLFASGANPYDVRKQCDGPYDETLCYRETTYIAAYLSRPAVRAALGVDPSVHADFAICDSDVDARFRAALDDMHPTQDVVAALLERGHRTLVYGGDVDWICNVVGNARWVDALDWSGADEYANATAREWVLNGKAAGVVRAAGPLTFATVSDAGHFVSYDKPKESLEMIRRWLENKLL